jgi:predicted dehydrogenase
MRISIIGCGLIGNKRANALGDHSLVACADINVSRAQSLAGAHRGCQPGIDWRAAATRPDVDVVIIATTNDGLVPAALAAVQAGKHVLIEKPAARNSTELLPLIEAAQQAGVIVKVGFNHRFLPAML